MRNFLKSKKGVVALLAALVVVAIAAVGAYAYFTSTGSGSGSASVGSVTTTDIELSGDAVGDLYPGGPDASATVSLHNTGAGDEYVDTISGTVEDKGDCLGSWFTVDDIAYGDYLAPDASDTASTAVRMNESGSDQGACQGKTLTITWSSN